MDKPSPTPRPGIGRLTEGYSEVSWWCDISLCALGIFAALVVVAAVATALLR